MKKIKQQKYVQMDEVRNKTFRVEFLPENEWNIQANEKNFISNYLQDIGFKYAWNFIPGLDNSYLYDDTVKKYFFSFTINFKFDDLELVEYIKEKPIQPTTAAHLAQRNIKYSRAMQRCLKRS